jgi:hypothetical protein
MATDIELLLHALFNACCESPRQNLACHPQEPDLSRLQDGYTTSTTDQWYFKRAANDSNQSHLIFTDVQAGYS